jgi:antitoxin (DNA-binding transcriptional repressor) of toxin-antitoxin stability system
MARLEYVVTRDYIDHMIAVGVRELKARLSEYLRRVREGETVLVTDRGVVVAEFGPPRRPAESRVPSRLEEMAAAGLVTLGTGNDPDGYPLFEPLLTDEECRQLLDEVRGDR